MTRAKPVKPRSKQNKYSIQLKIDAMLLWASGKTFTEVASILGVKSYKQVDEWKRRKMPGDWDAARQKWRETQIEKSKKAIMKTLDDIRAYQQAKLTQNIDAATNHIQSRVDRGLLDDTVAKELLMEAIEAQTKAYLTPLQATQGALTSRSGMSVAASNGGEGGVSILVNMMEEVYEKRKRRDRGTETGS